MGDRPVELQVIEGAESLRVEFALPEVIPTDALIEVELSHQLRAGWQTIASRKGGAAWGGPAEVTVSPAAGSQTLVSVSVPSEFFAGRSRVFLRLRAGLTE
jgi:hypothetical protein